MKKSIIVVMLFLFISFPMMFRAESIINGIALKEDSTSADVQGMYTAAYCAGNVIRKGAFERNVANFRAACEGINYPSTENFDYSVTGGDSVCFEAKYTFGNVAKVSFFTEPVSIQSLLQHCMTQRPENKTEGKDYLSFQTVSGEYFIDIDTLLALSRNWETLRSVLTIMDPFQSENMPPELLHDVNITVFDDREIAAATSGIGTFTIDLSGAMPMITDIDGDISFCYDGNTSILELK